jgi:hypothetical protein
MLGEKDRSFSTAGWTQVEPFARKRPEVVMAAFGVGTAYPRDALEIVAARRKALAQLLDTLKAVPAVGGGVLLIVVLAEVGEVPLEYRMEFVTATGNVPVCRRGRDGDCRAHIDIYWLNVLLASREG